ncbi:hypothetical protein [Streptomyces sp. NPDC055506]
MRVLRRALFVFAPLTLLRNVLAVRKVKKLSRRDPSARATAPAYRYADDLARTSP